MTTTQKIHACYVLFSSGQIAVQTPDPSPLNPFGFELWRPNEFGQSTIFHPAAVGSWEALADDDPRISAAFARIAERIAADKAIAHWRRQQESE